jgi:hypothetical protein
MLTVFAMFGWFCIGVGSRHLVSVLRKPKLVQKYVKGDKVWVRFGGGSYTAEILDASNGLYVTNLGITDSPNKKCTFTFREAEDRLALRDDT